MKFRSFYNYLSSYLLELLENKQMVALLEELQEKKPKLIDSNYPGVHVFQHFEETKTFKDVEVQVDYLVHLTG